jgi:hypothetical protein
MVVKVMWTSRRKTKKAAGWITQRPRLPTLCGYVGLLSGRRVVRFVNITACAVAAQVAAVAVA